jgi:DNA-3-methyladenine glycosylase II
MSIAAADVPAALLAAEAHLLAAGGPLAGVVRQVGRCTLSPDPDVFAALVRAVIAQLISTAAARSITTRLEDALAGKITPRRLLGLTDDELRACGIARGKAKALRGLAEAFRPPAFATRLAAADDATARAMLLPLHGVGPWTVDMVAMFAVPWRPDVLPVGDLGIRAGVRDLYQLPDLPTAAELTAVAEPWRPFRTVASWYIWKSRGWVPRS